LQGAGGGCLIQTIQASKHHYHMQLGEAMLKAIIFDVGGVLIRTHSWAGREKWATRLGLDAREFENFIFSGESGRQAQLGQLTAASHWRQLANHFGLDEAGIIELRRDFFAGDRLDGTLVAYIKRLRQADYRTGLLSNAPDEARSLLTEDYPIIEYFDGVVISAEVGVMKPNSKIYHLAAESVGVEPAEALFIDDVSENVAGARSVGMQALHFTDSKVVQRQLVELTGVE
jgi:epoxide hydrolase-like predicted phosphatase